jgi:predicted phage terminase large subunit-like protein
MSASALAAYRESVEDEQARRSLHKFVQIYWPVIEPAIAFKDNWHIHAICEHLEAVTRGEVKNLLVNVPPGTSKSTVVSVLWPAWEWATDSSLKYFGASYSDTLSIRDAVLCRDILMSERYTRAYPEVRLKGDANQKTHYGLVGGGWRIATTVGGRGTGVHPNRKIVDDPHNVKQAQSDAERKAAVSWFESTLSTRGMILDAATVVIMQRLHERDVSGAIMASPNYKRWEHLVIPMRHEPARRLPTTLLGYKDPRTKPDELLWPEVFTEDKVANLEVALGNYGTAGQLQQRPAPAGSGIIATAKFKLWRGPLPPLDYIIQSYDTAFTATTTNDPTACSVFGVFQQGAKNCVLLLDVWAEHMEYPEVRTKMIADWAAKYGGDPKAIGQPPRRTDNILIENKGSGIALIQDLQLAGIPAIPYNPGAADKIARAHVVTPLIDAGLFYVMESKKEPGTVITWARDFVAQCSSFPNAENDDMVDTLTQALRYLKDSQWLALGVVPEEQPEDYDYHRDKRNKQRGNPYG